MVYSELGKRYVVAWACPQYNLDKVDDFGGVDGSKEEALYRLRLLNHLKGNK